MIESRDDNNLVERVLPLYCTVMICSSGLKLISGRGRRDGLMPLVTLAAPAVTAAAARRTTCDAMCRSRQPPLACDCC